MSDQNIEMIVEECLQRLAAGERVDAILRDFPEQAAELGPLLAAATRLHTWHTPPLRDAARNAALARALAALPVASPARPSRGRRALFWSLRWRPALFLALALTLVFGAFGSCVAAAQTTLPGDPLYGLKLTTEQAHLQIITGHEHRAQLYLAFAGRRINELVRLEVARRVVPLSIVDELQYDYQQCRDEIAQAGPTAQQQLVVQYQHAVQSHSQALTKVVSVTSRPRTAATVMQAQTVIAGAASRLEPSPAPNHAAPATPTTTTVAQSTTSTTEALATQVRAFSSPIPSIATPASPAARLPPVVMTSVPVKARTYATPTSTHTLASRPTGTVTPTGERPVRSTPTPTLSSIAKPSLAPTSPPADPTKLPSPIEPQPDPTKRPDPSTTPTRKKLLIGSKPDKIILRH